MKLINILTLSSALLLSSLIIHAEPVNINTADVSTISNKLIGIGLIKAQAIVDYRKLHGKFSSAEQIIMVKGIGEKTFKKNLEDILL
ncbi:MAG: helix-hairpin-helix domain-containing protein [Pseudomonadota bacterium]